MKEKYGLFLGGRLVWGCLVILGTSGLEVKRKKGNLYIPLYL